MLKQLFQTTNVWQKCIAITLLIFIIANVPYVHAKCYISTKLPIAGLNCWFNNDVEGLVDESFQMSVNAEVHFNLMLHHMTQDLVNTVEFKQEFKTALELMFKQKIIFLLKDIDKVLNSITLTKPIKDIIKHSLAKVDQVILTTFHQYTESKQQLNKHSYFQLDDIHHKFRQNISRFLDESKYFSERVNCTIEATVAPISQNRQLITKKIPAKIAPFSLEVTSITTGGPLLPIPLASAQGNIVIESRPDENATNFDSVAEPLFCYQQLGLETPPETWEYSTIYDLKKCSILNTLTPQTPLKRILNVYLDLKAWAAKMACVQYGAGRHATQHYIWDWLEFGYLYNLWYIRYSDIPIFPDH